ncbi:tetratricopeptide repeat protein [Nonlabens tegetincola]|uniref:tetratricopeptide repeat protein n=1 Tax=Nonlabens tegetincola TaxID=323273 RepID=UPI000CF45B37|nr:tetratricopeptide repeat protein [Nonlabens tegetincola]PQJ18534.1 hypothetical protein BST93_08595 [Nonlabens tegetincola]
MHFEYNNEHEHSIEKFELMLRSNEVGFFDSDEFEQIIEHYLNVGQMVTARKAISLALSQHPSSVTIRLFKAEMLIFDNHFKEAHALLDELYEMEPNNAELFIQKANIYSKTENHDKAIKLLNEALDLTEDQADVYNLIGMEFLFMEDYSNAKVNFMKCLELDDQDYAALYNIIYCFDFLKENQLAIDYLNKYLDSNPYSEVAWHQVGKQYFDLKEYEKSLSAFDFAIISDDTFVGAYLEKGKVLEKLGRYNEAIFNYELTLGLDDPTSFAYLRLGKCHLKLGNEEEAIKYLKRTVKEDPLLDKGWIAIVDFYTERLNYQRALNYLDKAIEIDGDNALYWIRFAVLNNKLNFFEEAEYGYRKAIELGNYEFDTWIERADILIQLGEWRAAIITLEHGLEFYPNNPDLECRLSGVYYLTGKPFKGKYYLQNCLKAEPEQIIAFELLFPKVYKSDEIQQLITGL